jgi:MFS family permease
MSNSAGANADSPLLTTAYRTRFVIIMFLVAVVDFADRSVFSATAQSIKADLGFSDLQLGLLQGIGFGIIYACVGIPIGLLAERVHRLRLISACVVIWSAMTIACARVTTFPQLLVARIGVGMGEAGFIAPMTSLSSDLFPRQRRATAISFIMLGTPAGILLGATAGGLIAEAYHWRVAFYVMGVPGLLLALMLVFFLKEPSRGLADGMAPAKTPAPALSTVFKTLLSKPALLFLLLGGSLAQFGMSSISGWMAVFFERSLQLPPGQAGPLFGMVSAGFLSTGLLLGSLTSDWISKRDLRWSAWIPAIALLCAGPLFYLAFNQTTVQATVIALLVAGSVLLCYYAPTMGMIANMVGPRMRATTMSIYTVCYSTIGLSGGPTFVGWASDRYARARFEMGSFAEMCPGGRAPIDTSTALGEACRAASADGLRLAITTAMGVFILAAICYYLVSRYLAKDIYLVEEAKPA